MREKRVLVTKWQLQLNRSVTERPSFATKTRPQSSAFCTIQTIRRVKIHAISKIPHFRSFNCCQGQSIYKVHGSLAIDSVIKYKNKCGALKQYDSCEMKRKSLGFCSSILLNSALFLSAHILYGNYRTTHTVIKTFDQLAAHRPIHTPWPNTT